MKSPPRSSLRPLSTTVATFDELESIRARLERAQHAESLAIRKLGELSAKAAADRATFDRLLADVRETRRRAVAVYDEWNATVEKVREDRAGRARKRR